MSIHIDAKKEDVSNIVIMPGDPLRAKLIAENYLDNYIQINSVRNMFGYTGFYKNKRITVMSSGMGNPSMGIYSYELFNEYNVDYIIRIGTMGVYTSDINLFDVILANNSFSNTSYGKNMGYNDVIIKSSEKINNIIEENAKKCGINIMKENIHCTDSFYEKDYSKALDYDCIGVEMETFALFTNAYLLNKNASAILTVTDNLITHEKLSSKERAESTLKMIELALESAINL